MQNQGGIPQFVLLFGHPGSYQVNFNVNFSYGQARGQFQGNMPQQGGHGYVGQCGLGASCQRQRGIWCWNCRPDSYTSLYPASTSSGSSCGSSSGSYYTSDDFRSRTYANSSRATSTPIPFNTPPQGCFNFSKCNLM